MKSPASMLSHLRESITNGDKELVAWQICRHFNAGSFSAEQTDTVIDIFRLLAQDVEARVRRTLAENIKKNKAVPHDLALVLAQDVEESVAIPMLEYSEVLSDHDILGIIQSTRDIERLKAIAKRPHISKPVAHKLIQTDCDNVTLTLVQNKNATIAQDDMLYLVDTFAQEDGIIEALIQRSNLPMVIVEKMMECVAENLCAQLIDRYNLSKTTTHAIKTASKDEAMAEIMRHTTPKTGASADIKASYIRRINELVEHLHHNNRLTSSILLQALCDGNTAFFEAALARLSGMDFNTTKECLYSNDKEKFGTLFKKTGLPPSALESIAIIMHFIREKGFIGNPPSRDYKEKLGNYIIEHNYDQNIDLMPYLLNLINGPIQLNVNPQ